MAQRKVRIPSLPKLPDIGGGRSRQPRIPDLPQTPKGSRVKPQPIQPTFEEFRASWFWAKYQQSSYPEYLVYWGLEKLGLKWGEDYLYQVPELGQFVREAGSTVVDFVVINRKPFLAIPVQGLFWHPGHGEKYEIDLLIMRRLQQEKHMDVIPIDEDWLVDNPVRQGNAVWVVKEALNGIDHSRYAKDL